MADETARATLGLGSWNDPGTGAQFESAYLSMRISIDVALPGGGGLLFASTSFVSQVASP